MSYSTERAGRGRWAPTYWPAVGTLWTDDNDALGFIPAPNVDPTPLQALIDNASAAGKPATAAFDELTIGLVTRTGRLDDWRADLNNIITSQLGNLLQRGTDTTP